LPEKDDFKESTMKRSKSGGDIFSRLYKENQKKIQS
jgi:hypothetical protein